MKNLATLIYLLLLAGTSSVFAQKDEAKYLNRQAIMEDLAFLDSILQKKSSYQGLNGYDYQVDFKNYLDNIKDDAIDKMQFGLFLTHCIGKIGDRHSYVKKYDLTDELVLPFTLAPVDEKVAVLHYGRSTKNLNFKYEAFPYLLSINGIKTQDFLAKSLPEEVLAPKEAYFTRAVYRLRNIEESFYYAGITPPEVYKVQLGGLEKDTTLSLKLDSKRRWRWKDRLSSEEKEELNDTAIAREQFHLDEQGIAYVRLPDMVRPKDAPIFYNELHDFMESAKSSKALIVDIRSNDGGSRDLIFQMAKYFIHPDSIYVVNVAQQRRDTALSDRQIRSLTGRGLYPKVEFDREEQIVINQFLTNFKPMYELDKERFSDYHFTLLNGQKLKTRGYHYQQAIYILMNERCFSASSIFAAVFKDLPNITLAGITTDGSSGNSKEYFLPNSKIKIKLSTMVSFQKDGRLFDGYGTLPNIEIQRDVEHILWKKDTQLEALKEIVKGSLNEN